jgi:hypothetical protein
LYELSIDLQNNVAGARISNQTGKCEKLTDEYTTVEPGYEYIEKVYFRIEFQPAVYILLCLHSSS